MRTRIAIVLVVLLAAVWLMRRHAIERTSPSQIAKETSAARSASLGSRDDDYVGAAACAECHRAYYDRQSETHMAHALTTVQDYLQHKGGLPAAKFHDGGNGITYEIAVEPDGLVLSATRGTESARVPATFVVGSGFSGLTFLAEHGSSEWRELRLSYYPVSGEWDFTSGQEHSRPSTADEALGDTAPGRGQKCLGCHSTTLVHREGRLDFVRSQFGVSCERCHGPGRRHVEAARQAEFVPIGDRPFELALRSVENDVEWREQAAVRDLRVCGDCHGSHAMNPNVPDLTLSRFPIAALPRSKCFERSLGKLLCTDCHDPHSNAEHADMKSYDRVCLRCHGDSARRASDAGRADSRRQPRPPPNLIVCSVNPNDGCTGCHMPKRQPVYRGTFTHHRIAIHSETGAANSSSEP